MAVTNISKFQSKKWQATPPKHLKKATKEWFLHVIESYDLEQHHVRILTLACQAWDRGEQARELLDEHGLTYIDQLGNRDPGRKLLLKKIAGLSSPGWCANSIYRKRPRTVVHQD